MEIDQVQNQLGFEFKDLDLLLEALTHSSCLNEPSMGLKKHNESLAWLGDALIRWIASEKVYRDALSPKELHNLREDYVGKEVLSGFAIRFGLDKALRLPEGQVKQGGRTNLSNLHTVFEAVVGLVIRDQGFCAAKRFVVATVFAE